MELRSLAALGGLLAVGVAGCRMENPGFLPAEAEATGASTSGGDDSSAAGTTHAGLVSAPSPDTSSGEASDETSRGEDATGAIGDSGTGAATSEGSGSSGEAESTSGGPAPVCGDGVVDAGEACDDGAAPELAPGACRPDCAGEIATRRILAMPWGPAGDFAAGWDDPVALADASCDDFAGEFLGLPGEYRAMLVDGEHRVAALAPFDPTGAIDWVVAPYTAYVNLADELVWVTGEISLLGVLPSKDPMTQPNQAAPLVEPIALLGQTLTWTGLAADWTTAATCEGWRKKGPGQTGTVGRPGELVGFLDAAGALACNKGRGFICVEQ